MGVLPDAPVSSPTAAADRLEFVDGFVLQPDAFYSPSYRISPFCTADIADNLRLEPASTASTSLDARFAGRKWCFTECGKEGIALALAALQLASDDCVTILTTSGNRYISGCVTREIEQVCKWSRKIEDSTAAIFVNHEFGYPYRDLAGLRDYGVPIIEDACHSYLADTPGGDMGRVGDFIVFSLPKVYPLQMGGLLSYDARYEIQSRVGAGEPLERHLSTVLSHTMPRLDDIRHARRRHHDQLAQRFARLGCAPRFDLLDNDVPGAFLFTTPAGTDLAAMKRHGWRHGIECSVFYGEDAFFIPVHERLRDADLDYFYTVFARFLKGG
ncbi:DegT/DnrJ/EryC1/StrS aminotransferase family protein [Paraburkholderia fungorum]|uniref:DegT/DnrJ/EryC1/StrS aminotransferase family protein n=1 Tax=Paraburkholderia fungorum TaxID=134537 RepID=A0A1H0YME7_9BURK|nr:DegT/DnrJ/EryC1/StrS family aminotransferase [Paraburkholderia fungorum]SDQ16355.1 DegT/DnrJ/EryC1/StrS aminotransferase family protein [Paraburkholderia fungorum]